MRHARHIITLVVTSSAYAHAESPRVAQVGDLELMKYVAEAIAQAERQPETIEIDDEAPVDTPSSGVRVVPSRAIELTPRKNTDDLLRVVPGLVTSQHGSEGKGQQFFLRGFDAVHGADLSIRVGGIPINELSNVHGQGYADLGFVIPETVAGITSRKGPFDLEQGWFATAGAIDLELGVASRGRRASYEIGTTNRHRMMLLDAAENAPQAEFVAAELMHDDGFGEGRGSEKGSLMAQTELRAGRLTLRPLVTGQWSRFDEPGVVPIEEIASGYFERDSAPAQDLEGRSRRLIAGLGFEWHRGRDQVIGSTYLGWRGLQLVENFTGFLESPELGDARSQEHRAVTGGGRIAWRHRIDGTFRVMTGIEVIRDELVQSEDRVSTAGVIWRNERALAATTTTVGTWAGLEAKRGRWTAVGGARVDGIGVTAADQLDAMRNGSGMDVAVSPKIAIAYRHEGGTISMAAGSGVRPPEARAFTRRESRENMDTKVYDGGDADITRANAVELGAERRWHAIAVGVTGFATWIDRESVFDHVSGVNALRDGSRRFGAEAFVEATPLPYLAVRGDVTLVDARYVVTGNPVPGAPRLLTTVEARLDLKPWTAGLAGRYLGARPLIYGATAASATVVDAVAGYSAKRWSVNLSVDSLVGMDWNEGEYNFASRWDMSQPASDLPRVHISPGRPFGVRASASIFF